MLCKERGLIDLGEGRIIRPGMTKAELLASPVFEQFFVFPLPLSDRKLLNINGHLG